LISYDWEADRIGEMKPLAQAVTQHVMAKRARLVTVSLNPQGPALASQVTDELQPISAMAIFTAMAGTI